MEDVSFRLPKMVSDFTNKFRKLRMNAKILIGKKANKHKTRKYKSEYKKCVAS